MAVTRWLKNGDHPDDNVGETLTDPFTNEEYPRVEGAVVRFFRHPWTPGKAHHTGSVFDHSGCGFTWDEHGWIDDEGDGKTVCPGAYIIQYGEGDYEVVAPQDFTPE